jgi:ankyrin repeat protein
MIRASDSVVGEKSSTAEVHANQYGANVIHYLAATDDLEKLREFAQPRLLMQDHAGNSPLHYASESSSYRVAEYIISLFPDAPFYNQSHLTPGHFAARIGDLPMLRILSRSPRVMESVSFTGWNPLHY